MSLIVLIVIGLRTYERPSFQALNLVLGGVKVFCSFPMKCMVVLLGGQVSFAGICIKIFPFVSLS
jgi:hypothetical protein